MALCDGGFPPGAPVNGHWNPGQRRLVRSVSRSRLGTDADLNEPNIPITRFTLVRRG